MAERGTKYQQPPVKGDKDCLFLFIVEGLRKGALFFKGNMKQLHIRYMAFEKTNARKTKLIKSIYNLSKEKEQSWRKNSKLTKNILSASRQTIL